MKYVNIAFALLWFGMCLLYFKRGYYFWSWVMLSIALLDSYYAYKYIKMGKKMPTNK